MSSTAEILNPSRPSAALRKFAALIEPKTDAELEAMARESALLTRRNFGKAIRLFAPLYLSNECINNCAYCGFSRDNAILRVTLEIQSVVREARHLATEGFRNILLVAGEHPKFVSNGYLEACVRALAPEIPTLALEVAPMETADYIPLGGARRLSGDLRPRDLRRVAHCGAEARFRLAASVPGARVRRGLPPHRHRRAVRIV